MESVVNVLLSTLMYDNAKIKTATIEIHDRVVGNLLLRNCTSRIDITSGVDALKTINVSTFVCSKILILQKMENKNVIGTNQNLRRVPRFNSEIFNIPNSLEIKTTNVVKDNCMNNNKSGRGNALIDTLLSTNMVDDAIM